MRTMYDSIDPAQIPATANRTGFVVAGYDDGLYQDYSAMRTKFPNAIDVSIAVRSSDRAQVADCETGDMGPDDVLHWATVTMADIPNDELTTYCSASNVSSVVNAFRAANHTLTNFWIAEWDGNPDFVFSTPLPPGIRIVAKQYRSLSTPNIDVSSVVDYWPGVDPKVGPVPPPVTITETSLRFPTAARLVITPSQDITVKAVGVAVRSSDGTHHDFTGDLTDVSLKAGQSVTLTTVPQDLPSGTYSAYGCYLDSSDVWHNLPPVRLVVP